MHDPNYLAIAVLYFGPVLYFILKELIIFLSGYKFYWDRGILLSLIPGIGCLAFIFDIYQSIIKYTHISHTHQTRARRK